MVGSVGMDIVSPKEAEDNAVISKMADRVVSISDGRVVGVQTNETKVDASALEW